jgi:hypothetical protein
MYQPFKFMQRRIIHEGDKTSGVDPTDLGMIKIIVGRCKMFPAAMNYEHKTMFSNDPASLHMVYETELKGRDIEHVVGFDTTAVRNTNPHQTYDGTVQDLDSPEDPYLSFCFQYRSWRRFLLPRMTPRC